MTTLDSRMLTYLDTFGCSFDRPGSVRYRITSGPLACASSDNDLDFTITVQEGEGGAQHDVTIRRQGHRLVAQPAELTITTGDLVLWHSAASTPAYAVQGVDDTRGGFNSAAMGSQMVYSHAFGLPGDYEWVDALRGSVGGTIRVKSLDATDEKACGKWRRALARGVVVVIEGDRVEPAEVEILAGQTVFFAVSSSEGMTVTERQLAVG